MTIAVEYYAARDASPANRPWFSHLWVVRDAGEAIGALHTSWEGKIMMVVVDPGHRGHGVAQELVKAAAEVFPGRLTHGYPISRAGQRFVTSYGIPVHPVDERKGYEEWPDDAAEREGTEMLETVRGRGPEPFTYQPSLPSVVAPEGDE